MRFLGEDSSLGTFREGRGSGNAGNWLESDGPCIDVSEFYVAGFVVAGFALPGLYHHAPLTLHDRGYPSVPRSGINTRESCPLCHRALQTVDECALQDRPSR